MTVSERFCQYLVAIKGEPRILRPKLEREALPFDLDTVVGQSRLQCFLRFCRRLQRYVEIAYDGVGKEPIGKVEATGRVSDNDEARDRAEQNAERFEHLAPAFARALARIGEDKWLLLDLHGNGARIGRCRLIGLRASGGSRRPPIGTDLHRRTSALRLAFGFRLRSMPPL